MALMPSMSFEKKGKKGKKREVIVPEGSWFNFSVKR